MDFSKSYSRIDFEKFLKQSFLPNDLKLSEEHVPINDKSSLLEKVIKLGFSKELELVIYEIHHKSSNDARVTLSKEAFRLLANEYEDKALVIFVPEDSFAHYRLSFIEIELVEDNDNKIKRKYSNPKRLSYLLGEGIAYYTPNKYLNEKGRVTSVDDLRSRFSVDVLTKEFYQELSDWYAWAINIIHFPNHYPFDDKCGSKYDSQNVLRLITRLIFVWFLKQRDLIPSVFFDEKYINDNLLKSETSIDIFEHNKSIESKYYKAILQNLFFAMLNSPICEKNKPNVLLRRFRKKGEERDNTKLMRYEEFFKDAELFIKLANEKVPFLNGGLFDCLDDRDKKIYYDGFSDTTELNYCLVVPDYLFFGDEVGKNIDLSQWYGDYKKKKVSARGIIDILKRYNFAVEENTPFDQEVSLDA